MDRLSRIADRALTTWADVMRERGSPDAQGDATTFGQRSRYIHSDPVLSATVRQMSRWDLRLAFRVHRLILECVMDGHREQAQCLVELYLGRESLCEIGWSVHGAKLKYLYDGPVPMHTVATRMKMPYRRVRAMIRKGRKWVAAGVIAAEHPHD